MTNFFISLGIALAYAIATFIVITLINAIKIEKEHRYKQYLHVKFLAGSIVLGATVNFFTWIASNIYERVALIYSKYHLVHLIPFAVIAVFLIFKLIYLLYHHTYGKTSSDIYETKMPKHYYLEKGTNGKEDRIYVVPSYLTVLDTLKIVQPIMIIVVSLFAGVACFIKLVYESEVLIISFEAIFILQLFISELMSYLNGNVYTEKPNERKKVEDISDAREMVWHSLDKEYYALWKKQLLGRYNSINNMKHTVDNQKIKQSEKVSKEIARNIAENEIQEFLYSKILSPVMSGKNMIIESCHILGLSEIIVPIINILYSAKKKMLFLCDDISTVQRCEKWFKSDKIKLDSDEGESHILFHYLGKNTVTSKDAHVFVGTLDSALDDHNILSVKDADTVFCLNADKIMSEKTVQLNLLISVLTGSSVSPTQYVLFADRVNGLEPATNQVFMSNKFEYCVVNPTFTEEISANFWASERGRLQNQILPASASQYIGQLIPLAIPPLKFDTDIGHIHIIGANKPFNDLLNSLRAEEHFLKTYLNKPGEVIDKTTVTYEKENFVDIEDKAIVVVDDTNHNVALTLVNWQKYAKSNMFLNIVSEPYLLRDYIIANIDFFIENVDVIGNMLPIPTSNAKLSLYRLINHLCYDNVPEEFVLRTLKSCDPTSEEVVLKPQQNSYIVETLQRLTRQIFDSKISFAAYLDSTETVVAEKTYYTYKLLGSIKEELPERLFKTVTFVDSEKTQTELKKIPVFELYQNYLDGQYVVFNGKGYLIDKIDYHNGMVYLSSTGIKENVRYRQQRNITNVVRRGISKELSCVKIHDTSLKKEIISADINVNTNGYYQFNEAVSLVSGTFKFINIDNKKDGLKREYTSTNLLVIDFISKTINNLQKDCQFRIAFTISVLLNEIFETMFSDIKQYIITRVAVTDKNIYNNYADEEIVKMYQPIEDSHVDKGINIYITEDTELEKGITDTIVEKFDDIMKVLLDYLYWLTKDTNKADNEWYSTVHKDYLNIQNTDKYHFLKYGFKELPKVFDIIGAFDCLNQLIADQEDTITYSRTVCTDKRKKDDPFKRFEEEMKKCKEQEEAAKKSAEIMICDRNLEKTKQKNDKKLTREEKKTQRAQNKADAKTSIIKAKDDKKPEVKIEETITHDMPEEKIDILTECNNENNKENSDNENSGE